MRTLLSTFASALAILAANAAWADGQLILEIPTMECEECSGVLIKNFEKNPAVALVKADIEHRILAVTLKEEGTLSPEAAKSIASASGFPAKSAMRVNH